MTGPQDRRVTIPVNTGESNVRTPSVCGRQDMLWDERAGVPDVANPKKGMEDEFHIVRESTLKQEECSLWMEGAPYVPENFDTEFSTCPS